MIRLRALVLFLAFQLSNQIEDEQLFDTRNCIEGDGKPALVKTGSRALDTIRVLTSTLVPVILVQWNSTGHAVNFSGFSPYILHLVAQRIGVKYCWVPLGKDMPFDGINGLNSQLAQGKGELLVGTLFYTNERLNLIDFTVPSLESPFSIMIPFPEKTINKNALGQPFQKEVWINLLVAVVLVIFLLYFFNLALRRIKRTDSLIYRRVGLHDTFTFVLTVLLTQGNYYANQRAASRFVAGAWCLAALILGSAYSGVLLSFIMSPVSKPVIDSIYDVVNVPGLKVALDRARAADLKLQLTSQDQSTYFGRVVTAIEKTMHRCNTSADCIERTLTGHYVYVHGRPAVNQMIINDLAKVGKCRFTEAKEPFLNGYLCWGLPKRAPLNSDINNAMLELDAFGLSQYWKSRFLKVAAKCIKPEEPLRNSKLSFSHLSGTFVLLGIGLSLGILVFLVEKIVCSYSAFRKKC